MDVAKLSMAYSAAKIQNEASILTMKKVMDISEAQSAGLIEMMSSVNGGVGKDPNRGNLIDVRV